MKEFMTVRYCVDEIRRQAREQKYLIRQERVDTEDLQALAGFRVEKTIIPL